MMDYISLYRNQLSDRDEYEAYLATLAADAATKPKDSELAKINADFAELARIVKARKAAEQDALAGAEIARRKIAEAWRNPAQPAAPARPKQKPSAERQRVVSAYDSLR